MATDRLFKKKCPACGAVVTLGTPVLSKNYRCPKCAQLLVLKTDSPASARAFEEVNPPPKSLREPVESARRGGEQKSPHAPSAAVSPGASPASPLATAPPAAAAASGVPEGKHTPSAGSPLAAPLCLDPADIKFLRDAIATIEAAPDLTHIISFRGIGAESGLYCVEPGDREALLKLKAFLPGGGKPPELRSGMLFKTSQGSFHSS